ncbi:MAG TPA: hypothetical protein VIJ25_17040, partial [Methylococcales bacterium]
MARIDFWQIFEVSMFASAAHIDYNTLSIAMLAVIKSRDRALKIGAILHLLLKFRKNFERCPFNH